MIKASTEVLNLIAAVMFVALGALYLWTFFASTKREKKRWADFNADIKKMNEEHKRRLEMIVGGAVRPPPTPPEN